METLGGTLTVGFRTQTSHQPAREPGWITALEDWVLKSWTQMLLKVKITQPFGLVFNCRTQNNFHKSLKVTQ